MRRALPSLLFFASSASACAEHDREVALREEQARLNMQIGADQRAGLAYQAQIQKAGDERHDAEEVQAANVRARREQEAAAIVKGHQDECAATWRARFIDMQKAAAAFVEMRPKIDAKCKDLAKHCATFSSGHSACRGVTPKDQQIFDTYCGPSFLVDLPQNAACADVDPEPLSFDLAGNIDATRGFSRRTPPP